MKINWKKILIVCVLTFAIGIISIVSLDKLDYDFKVLSNDSGFDSDFGGGGTGGSFGGSGSTGGSFGGGNIYDSSTEVIIVLGLVLIICLLSLLFIFKSTINSNEEIYNEILQKYGMGNIDELKKNAYDSYVKIQEAWSVNDINKVRHLLSDEMYNTYKMQIITMVNKNQRNVMSDFKYMDAYIDNVSEKDNNIIINLSLDVQCKDYMIDITNEKVIKGNAKHINHYSYSLTFILGKDGSIKKCPNCHAKLPEQGSSIKCEYCGSIIERTSKNLVLIDKKMIRQNITK